MAATEIEAGMISAGQTVTVTAQDGQFGPAIGGKTLTVAPRTTASRFTATGLTPPRFPVLRASNGPD